MNYVDNRNLSRPSNPADETKHIIVQTALHMFAQRGIEGVSLSELRTASGQNNRSAIHYHFGNKDGLLDAVTQRLTLMMDAPMRQSVTEGKQLAESGQLDIPGFIRILGRPFISLYHAGREGLDCLRMLSHLTHETDDRQQARAFAPLQNYVDEMVRLLQTLMPEKKPNELAPLLFLSNCSIVEALICSPMLTREHTLAGAAVRAPSHDAFIEMTLAFATGGLLAASGQTGMSSR